MLHRMHFKTLKKHIIICIKENKVDKKAMPITWS